MTPVLRALLRQRRRLLLAAVAIALGVGYLAGALGLLDRIGRGLDELAGASADRADLVIEGGVAYESPMEQVRRLVPSMLADTAAAVEGVESASHRIDDIVTIVGLSGTPVVSPGLSEQPLGTNWPEDPAVAPWELTEGAPPASDDEALVDDRSAAVAGVGVGDTVKIWGKGKVGDYRVVGLVDADAAGLSEGSSLAVLTTPEARLMFDRPLDDSRIAIRVEPGADVGEIEDRIRQGLPAGTEVTDGATAARHQQESLTRSFALIRYLITGFGVLALLVGMLTVSNSLALLHGERRLLYANFRLAGARAGLLRRAALLEAVMLALAASLVGIPLGVGLAVLIEQALGALGTAVPAAGPPLTLTSAMAAVALGVLATVVAAWRPVSSACRVAPVEAVRPLDETKGRHGVPALAGAAAAGLVLGVAVAGAGVVAGASGRTTAALAVATAAAVVLVGGLPWVLTQGVATTLRVAPFRPPPLRRVAARDVLRSPRRTAATAGAVVLATAVLSGLAVLLSSFTESIDDVVGGLVTADLVVDSGTFTRGGLPGDLVEQLPFVDGVEAASGWQLGRGRVGQAAVRMTALDGDAALEVTSPRWTSGDPGSLDPGSAWVSRSLADATSLDIGGILPLTFENGFQDLRIDGIYEDNALLGDVVIDRALLERQVPAPDLAALLATDGSQATRERVEELASSFGINSVVGPEAFVDSRSDLLRGFQRVIQWMLLFTLLQALVGVVNTLLMSVGERRRELGLLRLSGASQRQVLRMVLWEGSSLSIVGTAVGVVAGTVGAVVAMRALASFGLSIVSLPALALVAITVGAVGVGVLAAWLPATVAGRVPPLEAVADSGVEFARSRRGRRAATATATPAPAPAAAVVTEWPAGPAVATATPTAAPAASWTADAPEPAEEVPGEVVAAEAVLAEGLLASLGAEVPGSDLSPEAAALLALYGEGLDAVPPPDEPPAPVQSVVAEVAPVAAEHEPEPMVPEPEPVTVVPEPVVVEPEPVTVVPEPEPVTVVPEPVVVEPVSEQELADELVEEGPHDLPLLDAVALEDGAEDIGEPPAEEIGELPAEEITEPAAEGATAEAPPAVEPAALFSESPVEPARPTGPAEGPADAPAPPAPEEPERTPGRRSRRRRPGISIPRRQPRREAAASASAAEGWLQQSSPAERPAPGAAPRSDSPEPTPPQPATAGSGERNDSMTLAVSRLDPERVLDNAGAITHLGRSLASGEAVATLVCGTVHGVAAALARTDRRLLVVVDRPGRPATVSLPPHTTGVVLRPVPGTTTVSVTLIDGAKVLEVRDVAEADLAEALVFRKVLNP
jgi:putative ABC transport system permease protein